MLVFFMLLRCNFPEEDNSPWKVGYHGALKNIMKKGDLSARIQLASMDTIRNLYAIGAKEDLNGEIQIFHSAPMNSRIVDNQVVIDSSLTGAATLLVYASVEKWKEIPVPAEVESYDEVEKFIKSTAKKNDINLGHPFPFMLTGKASSIDWHIIKWKEGDMEHSHEKHINSGLNGTLKNIDVEMIGFYSDAHHGIFTHHTTDMHIHFKTKSSGIAGHVDELFLGSGMKLLLPDK
jgi:acetolactate decarboxylase